MLARQEEALTDQDLKMLRFERQFYRYAGTKESAIREAFGVSTTRYFQQLNALLDNPEAMRAEPQLVARLRRLRTARQAARHPRRAVFRH